jgi:hypothetical protein
MNTHKLTQVAAIAISIFLLSGVAPRVVDYEDRADTRAYLGNCPATHQPIVGPGTKSPCSNGNCPEMACSFDLINVGENNYVMWRECDGTLDGQQESYYCNAIMEYSALGFNLFLSGYHCNGGACGSPESQCKEQGTTGSSGTIPVGAELCKCQ